MTADVVVKYLVDFLSFFLNSIYDVPLDISIGGATVLTFFWLVDKIFSRLSVWRTVVVTVWGMLFLDLFTPVRDLSKQQLWPIVIIVGIAVSIVQWGLRSVKVRMPKTLLSKERGFRNNPTTPQPQSRSNSSNHDVRKEGALWGDGLEVDSSWTLSEGWL